MDQKKNKMEYIYSYLFSFIIITFIILILLYNKNGDKEKNQQENNDNKSNTLIDIVAIDNMLESWAYDDAVKKIELKWTWSIDREEKMRLVYAYLSYWNYFYKEQENSKKAMDILNTLDNAWDVLYYKWFAQEIIKNYTWALDYYNNWLDEKDIKNEYKSLILNQIGHLYDLKWEFDKVFAYYDEAYKLDEKNAMAIANLWRYYIRTKDYSKAYELFNKALNITDNLPLKSELTYGLSSLELEMNGLKPDIEKSIDYARQSIDYYPNYPMWYVALANGLFMKNDLSNNIEIEQNLNKSIELNPNWHDAYYLYALHEIDKSDYDKALDYINKTMQVVNIDMILMDSEREKIKNSLMFDAMLIWTLRNLKGDNSGLMNLINMTWKLSNWKTKTQIKRINYWVFEPIKDNKEFKDLIKNYK